MDINNNQLINVFTKGMNTDTSDAMLSSELYRYAENLRFVTNTNSSEGELRLIGSTKRVGTASQKQWDTILDMHSVDNKLVLVVEKNKKLNVFVCTPEEVNGRLSLNARKVLNNWLDICSYNINSVVKYESDNNIKLYICDGVHEIMSIRIDESADNSSIRYTQDVIPHSFELLKPITIVGTSDDGILKPAKVQYAYLLYNNGAAATKLSPLSNSVELKDKNGVGYSTELDIHTSRAVTIRVPISSKLYDKIKIYRITYHTYDQLPTIELIYDNVHGATIMDLRNPNEKFIELKDNGGIVLNTLSVEEFAALNFMGIIPKHIESKGDYLFASNIKYVLDDIDASFKEVFDNIHLYFGHEVLQEAVNKDQAPVKTLRRGETYRYGIILYDNVGRASSVIYYDDITIDNRIWVLDNNSNIIKISISFYVKQLLPDNVYAYEIVRCERTVADSVNLVLGILGLPVKPMGWLDDNYVFPTEMMTTMPYYMHMNDSTDYDPNIRSVDSCVMFACPEYSCLEDSTKQMLNQKDISLKTVKMYTTNFDKDEYISWGNAIDGQHQIAYHFDNFTDDKAPSLYLKIVDVEQPCNDSLFSRRSYNIKNIAYTESPDWNSFAEESIETTDLDLILTKYKDALTICGQTSFVNWTGAWLFASSGGDIWYNDETNVNYLKQDYDYDNRPFTLSAGGLCILLSFDGGFSAFERTPAAFEEYERVKTNPVIHVANILKNAVPYGGKSENAINNSVYYSCGGFNKCGENGDRVDLDDGDTYIIIYNYIATHYWYDPIYRNKAVPKITTVYRVPIETSINSTGLFANVPLSEYILYKPCIIDVDRKVDGSGFYYTSSSHYAQDYGYYDYNSAYGAQEKVLAHTPNEQYDIDSNKHKCRIHYSEPKTNGLLIDSWLDMKPANYIDVDDRYGEITGMRVFYDKFVFWQEHATGLLSVNERSIVQDTNNSDIILGVGGVAQRYDYLSTMYGMKDGDDNVAQSLYALYWYDYYNNEILLYSDKLSPLTKANNLRNYMNDAAVFDENAHLIYDSKYDEILTSFLKDSTLVFNEKYNAFTAVYTYNPKYYAKVNKDTYVSSKDGYVYKLNYMDYVGNSKCELFETNCYPLLKYIVNKDSSIVKTFDIQTMGGSFYGNDDVSALKFTYKTPLKQESSTTGLIKDYKGVSNREYDFRLDIPRNGQRDKSRDWGDRMRGKTMQCELSSTSNSTDFSLQYIITKYRPSWS